MGHQLVSLNIVAHTDDDLLFLNPDILTDLKGGEAHIVYLTTGAEGKGREFIYKRRQAIAYAYKGCPKVTLNHLGLNSNDHQHGDDYGDLYRLYHEETPMIRSIDDTPWSKEDLVMFIQLMVAKLNPDIIRTHDPDASPAIDEDGEQLDHLDHIYTAKFVRAATRGSKIPLYAYEGYPIRHKAPNVILSMAYPKLEMWKKYQEIETSVAGNQWDIAAERCYKRQLQ